VGNYEFIESCRKKRKMVGGGLRQAGIIAAPGIVALDTMIGRLKEDHDNAKHLAQTLSQLDALSIDLASVQTNIVVVDVTATGISDDEFRAEARKRGLCVSSFGPGKVRLVTHYGISREDVDRAASIIEDMVTE
jgi:threonine aldolase